MKEAANKAANQAKGFWGRNKAILSVVIGAALGVAVVAGKNAYQSRNGTAI